MKNEKILFDDNWIFHLGDVGRDWKPRDKAPMYYHAKTKRALYGPACPDWPARANENWPDALIPSEFWRSVTLPHDYVIEGTPDEKENCGLGYLKAENAWYRKIFSLPAEDEGKRLTLLFEGIAVNSEIWLNGCLLHRNFGGYRAFEVDITDTAKYGEENVLAVYVSTEDHEGWWYEGGGIYRHVWLRKTDPIAVDLWGIFAAPRRAGDGVWDVPVTVTARNDTDRDEEVRVVCTLLDREGNAAGECAAEGLVPFRGKTDLTAVCRVAAPHLWDLDDTYQYVCRAELSVAGETRDVSEVRFGFREFVIDPNEGLFLNGKHVKIKGVCGHADTGLLGKAVSDNVQRYKVRLMKEMGANGFRCSHYMHAEATMDALDDEGFIVMDETRRFESTPEGISEMETLMRRDRNRPSVLFWSIGNEEPHHVTEEGRRICRHMLALARRLDETRPVMTAVSNTPDKATVYDELDAIGINYNLQSYDFVHEKYPDKGIFASECCATGTTRGWYFPASPERGYVSGYDSVPVGTGFMSREETCKHLMARKWVLGGYQWIAFEHRGETQWPRLCSQSGAIDLFLQKKDAFWQNLSHWEEKKPVCHLLPHWNWTGLEGTPIRVVCYLNQPEAELFLNERSLGRVRVEPYGHAEWNVPYAPGRLEVIAYGADGSAVARDAVETTLPAAKLVLTKDNDGRANGQDVLIFTVTATDAEGREVPDAEATLSFSVAGPGRLVGTGSDVCDHVPVPSPVRRMRAGRAAAAVRLGDRGGKLEVYVEAPGLGWAVWRGEV